ncbi:guanitoxin biosynthesis heme-dependent pre-guanitoxin N-hydroxylase GntA [Aquisalinus flavus]|uniref:YqcI/YcgG family protein n=1 Tax=Aquisalinus flavus TaxID=1526572 RepID=A0A8J2V4L6_9PROT|nr:guanitoxin biosynthesis heme-dependent pre-guanitoxin N-hydroxylase GntA [Aquisalinus flavus]MBD0426152.1 YqcI/YcgG family protein [Aquisalinus flavus]UNE48269.1 YqcI/YcgG family protein [Aquisalinus flavus]GGD10166.1 hypothetical protein GCM10011342_18870 [Aquisalinus flavus]
MQAETLRKEFDDFIRSDEFPCVGAKAALARGTIDFFAGEHIDEARDDLPLYKALTAFGKTLDNDAPFVQSFVAAFSGPTDLTEQDFEKALWNRLQALHNIDAATGHEWTEGVDSDASSPHFSLSIDGQAYFVVGLHPHSSREARRFSRPILVFNSHEQFEALRADGRFDKMKDIIRERDIRLEGDINPMLNDFGYGSEARQYSGRMVGDDWQCPLAVQEPEKTLENHD